MHPLSLLLYENTNLNASDIMLRLLDETSKYIQPLDNWTAGIQLSIPPYPNGSIDGYNTPIEGIVSGNLKHLWFADVAKQDKDYKTGNYGLLGYCTARGVDESEAIRRMYRTVGNIKVNDLQYRNDIGRNIQPLFNKLRQHNWII